MSTRIAAGETIAPSTDQRALLANSTLAFVLAAMVNSTLHELAHAVAALSLGLVPTVAPFQVSVNTDGTVSQRIIIASAGPVFSLVMGLVLMVVARSWGRGFVRLFFLWLAFMGVMNFVGYLFIAPFAQAGDTGQVLALLGAPGWVYLAAALVGVGGQFWISYRFAGQVKRYAHNNDAERQLAYFAWMLGTAVVLVLTLVEVAGMGAGPAEMILVFAYGLAVGVFGPMQFIFHDRFPVGDETLDLRRVNVPALAVTIILAALLIGIAMRGGVRLG